jgi:hypothetical protein
MGESKIVFVLRLGADTTKYTQVAHTGTNAAYNGTKTITRVSKIRHFTKCLALGPEPKVHPEQLLHDDRRESAHPTR